MNDLKILYVYHVGNTPEEDARIALAPSNIKLVASRDIKKNDRDLKEIHIFFMDGDNQLFEVSGLDLMRLESVVAGYSDEF